MDLDEIKALMKKKPKKGARPYSPSDVLNTGSTMLNLAISGNPNYGFIKGRYIFFVGDTSSGKTFGALTCLAEAAKSKNFNDHRFIFDNAEDGALMDMRTFFGDAVADRLEAPGGIADDGDPICSEQIEDFYYFLDDALNDGRPFIYVLDSMDALSSNPETKKFKEKKDAHRKGKDAKGEYSDGKAKVNSSNIRQMRARLQNTGSILIVLNQTRDNPAAGLFQSSKTHSGGHALSFYAHIKLMSSVVGKFEKTVRGKKLKTGINTRIRVVKNRVSGRDRAIKIPIHYDYGIDDIGSMVDFLLEYKHWKKNASGMITAKDFDLSGYRDNIIQSIEKGELEKDLKSITATVWKEVEDELTSERRKRY